MTCDKCGQRNADIGAHRHGKDICRMCLLDEQHIDDGERFAEEDRIEEERTNDNHD